MARVTAAEVKEIMDHCTVTDVIVDTFIDAANDLVTRVFSGDETTTTTTLKEIERFFAAHLIACTISRTTSDEKIGDASLKYTGQWGKNLDSTPYGQIVKQLDTTGKMGNIGKQALRIYAIKSFD